MDEEEVQFATQQLQGALRSALMRFERDTGRKVEMIEISCGDFVKFDVSLSLSAHAS